MLSLKKGVFTLFLSVLMITGAWAQGSFPVLEWSPEYSARSAKFDRLLQVGDKGFYTYKTANASLLGSSRDEYFAYYNRYDLGENWLVKNARWEWKGRRVDFKTSVIIGETQYLFYESYDRQADQRYLLCRTLDSNATLSEVKVMEVLDSRRRARGDFDIQLSKTARRLRFSRIRLTSGIPQRTFTSEFLILRSRSFGMQMSNCLIAIETLGSWILKCPIRVKYSF